MVPYLELGLGLLVVLLFIFNVCQFLQRRAALHIAEVLYVMTRHVREKIAEANAEPKDIEIVEAHLFSMITSARSLLRTLGRKLRPDPALDLTGNAPKIDDESLVRLADNILFSVKEDAKDVSWNEVVDSALDKFHQRTPELDREGAKRIMTVVAKQHEPDNSYTLREKPAREEPTIKASAEPVQGSKSKTAEDNRRESRSEPIQTGAASAD